MASPYTQALRIGRLETPLGLDRLALTSFEGKETVSRLFEYRVEALNAEKALLTFDDAIGKHCTVKLKRVDGGERIFDGMLAEARWIAGSDEGNHYELVLRPWLWMLSKRVNSLIFHEKTAPQIIEQVLGEHGGLADFQQSLSRSYRKREYCAQYNESDMDFVCRLMEEEGIFYFFRHSDGAHKMIMGDSSSASVPVSGGSRPFIAISAQHNRDTEHLSLWRPERRFTTGKVATTDYNFEKPSSNMKSEKTGDAKYEHGKLESYLYPGRYAEQSEGTDYAQVRLDMNRAEDNHFHAEGDCATLYPGALVDLTDHPDSNQNKQFFVLKASHSFKEQSYRSGAGPSQPYQGVYEFMRSDQTFAPAAATPRPFIRGPQTAVVVGDGEIDCDKYGRILVRFHWDRKSDKSRRVRVAQVSAGQSWGAIFIPRVGHEVVVDFLEGDPDQPIVIGSVYNADNMPPFGLPGSKNISGWKSNSTTGGGGYNELVIDDSKGSELVRFRAQKDLDSTVENDESRHVKHDRSTTVDHDETLDVANQILIKAGTKITIQCGQSSITMDPMSIKIEAPTVEISADMQFKSTSKMLSQHEASAMMIINGTLVKIN
jgi:type VI secretion system secreted protein VgrG